MNTFSRFVIFLITVVALFSLQAQSSAVLYMAQKEAGEKSSNSHDTPLCIPFELDWNLIWIAGSVDNRPGFFILDTGAPTLIINSKGRKQASRKSMASTGRGLGGEVSMRKHRVESFSLGGVEQGAQSAYKIDLREIEERAGREIHGLVGYEQLSDYELLIDYPARKMEWYPAKKNSLHETEKPLQTIKFDRYTHLPLLRLQQGKERLLFVLDTGAGASLIDSRRLADLEQINEDAPAETYLVGMDGNRQAASIFHIPQLQLGSETLEDLPLVATDLAHLSEVEGLAIDGVLGTDFLKNHRISIDYKKQRLHFWPSNQEEAAR